MRCRLVMALTHGILQFKLENNDSPNHVINIIEKLLMQNGLQDHVTETFRSKVKPLLMLLAEAGSRYGRLLCDHYYSTTSGLR